MKTIKQLSVGKRVWLPFAALGAMLLIIGGWFYFSLRAIERSNQLEQSRALKKLAVIDDIGQDVGQMQAMVVREVFANDVNELKLLDQAVRSLEETNAAEFRDFQQYLDHAEERQLYDAAARARKFYWEQTQLVMALDRANQDSEATKLINTTQAPAYDQYLEAINRLIAHMEGDANAAAAATTALIAKIGIVGDILVALAALVALGTVSAVAGVVRRFREDNRHLQTEVAERKRTEEQLRVQSTALDAAANAIVIADHNGTIQSVNPAFTALTGYTAEEAVGKTPRFLKSGQQDEAFYRNLWQTISSGQVWSGELTNRRKDGSLYPEEMTITPLRNGDGVIARYIAIKQDITKRKQTEEALGERSQLAVLGADVGTALTRGGTLAEMLRGCSEAIVRQLDVAFARVWTFNAHENMLELQASAGMYTHLNGAHGRVPVGTLKIGLIAKERKPHLTNQVVGDPRVGDQEWAKREGMVAFAGYPLVVDDRLVGVVAMFARHPLTDTTLEALASIAKNIAVGIEQKHAAEELRASEKKFKDLFESSRDAIMTFEPPSWKFTSGNPAAVKIFGAKNEKDLMSHSPWELSPDRQPDGRTSAEKAKEMIATAMREGSHFFEWTHRRISGEEFPATVLITRMQSGEKLFHQATIRDITESKRFEAKLFQSQKMETVGKLAGGIAHEFNSIMTAIIGQSELMLYDLPAGNPLRKNATEIHQAADRAATLTRQLLAYGRKQILQPDVLDLDTVLAGMENTLRHLAGRDVDVLIAPPSGPKLVKADPGQIEQVIVNIVMNAADAMPRGGKLTLETAEVFLNQEYVSQFHDLKAGDYVMLAITDTGAGMSEAVKARLFEPFFTTKEVGKGTGLGLATCHGIVKQSGGHINVYSEPGRGATFKIYLPKAQLEEKLPGPPLQSPGLPRGTETILLVEDDPALREMAAALLGRLGYTVLTAGDGLEALNVTHQRATGHIDLLFTDVVMPHMSGKELSDRIQALYPRTKILFTSAYTETAIVHQGVLNPGITLLQKPFTPSALAGKVREVLDSDKPAAPL